MFVGLDVGLILLLKTAGMNHVKTVNEYWETVAVFIIEIHSKQKCSVSKYF